MLNMNRAHRFLCFMLAGVLSFTLIIRTIVNALDPDSNSYNQGTEQDYNYLADETVDIFNDEYFLKDVKQRIDTPDDDLRTLKYLMEDGTAEMRIFNEPIKYVAEDGTVHTKSLEIVKTPDNTKYGYSNLHNDVKIKFGSLVSDGVSLDFNGHSLSVYPLTDSRAAAELTRDNKTIKYNSVFSDNINIEYQADYSGLKENIVIDQYTGINDFSFIIETDYAVIDNNGTIELVDKDGNNIGSFGAVFVTDSNGKSVYGSSSVSKLDDSGFLYSLTVPEDFLIDNNTEYPVIIEQTFTFNFYTNNFAGYKQIYDVTLYQYGYVYQPQNELLTVSYETNYGFKRTLIKFPNLNTILKQIGEDNILFVSYSYQGITNNTNTVYVNPMSVNWSHNATSLSNTTYDSLYNGYNSGVVCSSTIHYGPGKIDFTDIAIGWINNDYSNYGIIISGMGNNNFASVEHSTSYYRPYITVDYKYIYNSGQTVDPFKGLFKLIPFDSSGFMLNYAMKNDNNIVMRAITDNVYDSDQLVYIKKETQGYTIQNPYNDKYLTSDNYSLFYSATLTSGSYWSFVYNVTGYYIVGTYQEQLNCLNPGTIGSAVGICTLFDGISGNQATVWSFKRQIDKIPFKLKNAYSHMYLTVANAYDYDEKNIYQHGWFPDDTSGNYCPVFGSQGVRPVNDGNSTTYKLYLMCSKNGRCRSVSWDTTNGNAIENLPVEVDNKLSISVLSSGYVTIRQKNGSHYALTVIDGNEGSETGTSTNSSGNIIFASYSSYDIKQKWILEFYLEQFKKEVYYSQFNLSYPLVASTNNIVITSDYGPRSNGSAVHDGLDLSENSGVEVYSSFSGVIKQIRLNYDTSSANRGIYVIVESNSIDILSNGSTERLCAIYQHLQSVNTSLYVGQTIQEGTFIGKVGITGLTGSEPRSHLHYSLFPFSAFECAEHSTQKEKFIDPLMFYNDFSFRSNGVDLIILQ